MENRMNVDHGASTMSRPFRSASARTDNGTTSIRGAKMNTQTIKSKPELSGAKDFRLQELAMMSLSPILRSLQHWWLQRAERHYLICADVEQQRAKEAQMNVAYYQKRAALARSARN
jgi:hypothetical protein